MLVKTVTKFDWKRALDKALLDTKLSRAALLIAGRLADRADNETLTYRWGYDLLADDIGGQHRARTVRRGLAELEAVGWIKKKRGGRDDKVQITLLIPDNMLSTMNAPILDRNGTPYRTDSVASHKETRQQGSASLRSAGAKRAPRGDWTDAEIEAMFGHAEDASFDDAMRMIDEAPSITIESSAW